MEDEKIEFMVRKFATDYGFCLGKEREYIGNNTWRVKPYDQTKYYIHQEWTDGDEFTVFIDKRTQEGEWETVCEASINDWEEERPKLLYERLVEAATKAGIIHT